MGFYRNISPEDRELLKGFRADESWSQWGKTLHPLTLKTYESVLLTFMKPMHLTPTELRKLRRGRSAGNQ